MKIEHKRAITAGIAVAIAVLFFGAGCELIDASKSDSDSEVTADNGSVIQQGSNDVVSTDSHDGNSGAQ